MQDAISRKKRHTRIEKSRLSPRNMPKESTVRRARGTVDPFQYVTLHKYIQHKGGRTHAHNTNPPTLVSAEMDLLVEGRRWFGDMDRRVLDGDRCLPSLEGGCMQSANNAAPSPSVHVAVSRHSASFKRWIGQEPSREV